MLSRNGLHRGHVTHNRPINLRIVVTLPEGHRSLRLALTNHLPEAEELQIADEVVEVGRERVL